MRAERRLLVAHLDVAPDQKEQQFAVRPHFSEVESNETPRGS